MKTMRIDGALTPAVGLFQNSDDPIPIGTEILGKYTVVKTLGKGGMGIVVAARHHRLGELHAIKFLLPGALGDNQAVSRFEREARAAARLRSEHVARVMDVGRTESGEPYMIMEHLEGQDLKSIVRRGPLPIEDAVEYLLQICDAVAEAHRSGIVHRDIKPANLFLTTRANGTPCVKVLDFGIAKISDPLEQEITREGMIGSLKYMSPEQILRSKTADWRTDIWALGMTAYEFVAAKTPFGGSSQVDLISNIMGEEPEPPSALRVDLPPAIEAIILKCLRKEREERFQSVNEFADALREAVGLPPENAPRIRAPFASVSAITVPPVVEEKTQRGFGVTEPAITPHRHALRWPLAVGSAVATVGSMLVLVAGLRRSSVTPPAPAKASVEQTVAANPAMLAAAPVVSAAPLPQMALEVPAENVVIELPDVVDVPNVPNDKPRKAAAAESAPKQIETPSVSSLTSAVAPSSEPAPSTATNPASSAVTGPVDVPVKPTATALPSAKPETKQERGVGLEFD